MPDPASKRASFRPTVNGLITGSVAALVLISLIAVIALQWTVSRRNTIELMDGLSGLFLEYLERAVHNHLQPALAQAESITRRIEDGSYELRDRERLRDLLTGALAATPQVATIRAWDENLSYLAVVQDREGKLTFTEGDDRGKPFATTTAPQMRHALGPAWGDLVARPPEVFVNLRWPVRQQGKYRGFMASGITVDELSRLTTDLSEYFDTTAFILHGREQVLAHPNMAITNGEFIIGDVLPSLHQVGDVVLAEIWNGKPLSGFEDAANNTRLVKVTLAGIDYVVISRQLTAYGQQPWIIGGWFTHERVSKELTRVKLAGAISILLLVVSIIGAILISRLVSRPVKRVAEGASLVGRLDLEKVGRLAPSRVKELNEQAEAFNTMLASLRSFETYVPRSLVRRLMRKGEHQEVASEARQLVVLFTDIAGFTSMSETMSAQEVAGLLNAHFALIGRCVEAESGTVDKFIGDALMAFWGAPDKQPDIANRACRAALAIRDVITADNHSRREAGHEPIRVRVGIHMGEVVVGNIGWPGRINYTIVGDTVNACQRLEALGKDLDAGDDVTLLISGEVVSGLSEPFAVEPIGAYAVKGKTAEIEVFRLLAQGHTDDVAGGSTPVR